MASTAKLSSSRQRLLDAARGVFLIGDKSGERILRSFPLKVRNFKTPPLATPADFHAALCETIALAERRVYLASLYVGPAANPASSPKEQELLNALQLTAAPDIKILLDRNRALRPVPVTRNEKESTTITSAEACYRILRQRDAVANTSDAGIYLLTVLPPWKQRTLENPYNEVAGVAHLKCYIVDDDLILTGANLSEEYFCDRTDRYLWLTATATSQRSKGNEVAHSCGVNDYSNSLVECYAALVQALCQHAEPYKTTKSNEPTKTIYPTRSTRKELLDALVEILTEDAQSGMKLTAFNEGTELQEIDEDAEDKRRKPVNAASGTDATHASEDDIVAAVAIPTFQAPPSFFRGLHNPIPDDTAIIASFTESVAETEGTSSQIRLASAYLNLTEDMLESMALCPNTAINLLTAGRISHGFKPNPAKVGNKGKAWIPAVFDALGRQSVDKLKRKQRVLHNNKSTTNLWYYQREGWTFHAKGIWFGTTPPSALNGRKEGGVRISDPSSLCAVTHGSGNYGARSAYCDMESNLILILCDGDGNSSSLPVHTMFQNEWNEMCNHAAPAESEEIQPLSRKLRLLLPVIRPFF